MVNSILLELRHSKTGTVIGNSDKNIETVFDAVKHATEIDVFRGHDWSILQRLFEVYFSDAIDYYILPLEYDHIMNETAWDHGNQRLAIGGLTAVDMQMLKNAQMAAPSGRISFMELGHDFGPGVGLRKALEFYPKPAETTPPIVGFSCYIISKNYILDGDDNSTKDSFTKDDDTTAFDTELVKQGALVRMLRTLGMSFQSEQEDFDAMIKERAAKDQATRNAHMEGGRRGAAAYPNTPGYVPVGWSRRHSRWGW